MTEPVYLDMTFHAYSWPMVTHLPTIETYSLIDAYDMSGVNIVDHRLPEHITVYSGIKHPLEPNHGGYHRIPGFAFTTLSRSTAIMYAKSHNRQSNDMHVLQVFIPKGAVGMYVPQNVGVSKFNSNELIMPKDSILHVANTPHTIELDDSRKVHVWYSRRLPNMETHY